MLCGTAQHSHGHMKDYGWNYRHFEKSTSVGCALVHIHLSTHEDLGVHERYGTIKGVLSFNSVLMISS